MSTPLAKAEEIIELARQGKMFILVDDEDRENEGDLVIPAEYCDAEAVNFMATHGRGLICLPMTSKHIRQLGLPPMAKHNSSRHETAFTVSIEAREGVTTGISAADRAKTIAAAANPQARPNDIATPGHIFPLEARDGGVLVRAGHTEAAVDIARLAGCTPAGVICEIMNDDGTMARLPDLIPFAEKHGLKIGTIADLIAYRRRREKLVEAINTAQFESAYGGEWQITIYTSRPTYAEHIVLQKGTFNPEEPVLVRVHAADPLHDMLGDMAGGRTQQLQKAMQKIAAHGSGVLVLIREPRRTTVSDLLAQRMQQGEASPMLRDYGIGAQILVDLGIKDMILLSNSRTSVIGLEGYGLTICGYEPL
jgi:3,4-dihydroxy 2-butanone 4-phosphate synthase/GTP cyclohydrolase II